MQSKEVELTTLQKAIALSVVTVLFVAVIAVFSALSGSDPGTTNASYSSCEGRYDPTPCPEPDYDSQSIEDSKKYPDDMPGDAPDTCGNYDCDTLRQEFEQYEQ